MELSEIYWLSKPLNLLWNFFIFQKFPSEERYSLTDQIRRSSRSVNSDLAEDYRKRRYPNHFVRKISDADMESDETKVWLQFALACQYIPIAQYDTFNNKCEKIARLLVYIMNNPERFLNK